MINYLFNRQERERFGQEAQALTKLYDDKLAEYIEESEIIHRMEMTEVEERKGSQIAKLIESHDRAFNEMKNYYNDVTLNNMALISSLKEQMEELRKQSEKNERLMAEVH